MARKLSLPLEQEEVESLEAGDEVLLSGNVLTMRDASLKRLEGIIDRGEEPPVDIAGELIFHAGPTPVPEGRACGSIGPTTSARMDRFLPLMLELGVKAVLGKGPRGVDTSALHKKYTALYFVAVGGLGALYGEMVEEMELVFWGDLGPEGLYRVKLKDFPAIVAIDSRGKDIFPSLHSEHRRPNR